MKKIQTLIIIFMASSIASGQVICPPEVDLTVDPASCAINIEPQDFSTGADLVVIVGLPPAAITNNGTALVTIIIEDIELPVPEFSIEFIQGTVDSPTDICETRANILFDVLSMPCTCPNNPSPIDSDLDNICDDVDNCVGVYNPSQSDLNNDNIGDACSPIPTMGEWGIIALSMIMLVFGVVAVKHQKYVVG